MIQRFLVAMALSAVVALTFAPALRFQFLNWDDRLVIVENAALTRSDVAEWAATTTYMDHYQPASWLVWAALGGAEAGGATRYHAANIGLHLLVALLLFAVARRVYRRVLTGRSAFAIDAAAGVAAVFYAVHPLRVEVVAWVSAMPYALAAVFALVAMWMWLRAAERHPRPSWTAVIAFAISLAARPVALGLPIVFLAVDRWLFGRRLRASLPRAVPFLVLSAMGAAVELYARMPGLADVPWSFRLQSALTAPFLYLWHTLWPVRLTPLDVLPLEPVGNLTVIAAAAFGLLVVTLAAWLARTAAPSLLAGWIAYLALLAPAAGLVPSGLQASADRYVYLPGIVLAMGAAGIGAAWMRGEVARGRLALIGAAALTIALAVTTREALTFWSDSLTLWGRVVALDPANDAGLFNLAVTFSEQGRPEAAAERYRALLAVNPQHTEARANLDRLDAARLEREGNALAGAGRLSEAADRYRAALARDPKRAHSQAARGMSLATLGRSEEAIPHLSEALRLGVDDVAVANTLAGLLLETSRAAEARGVLETALEAHPNEMGLAHNLARLLVTLQEPSPDDLARALRLAEMVVESTGGQDARALDTLATALAANGRIDEAREVNARAVAVAEAQGDTELAVQITARGQGFGK
jgi:tetratricopeptide (TPR) repeat protein